MEEFSRQAKSKVVVVTLEWLGLGNDMCPKEIRSRKSSFEMSKISLLGIWSGSWGFLVLVLWIVPWVSPSTLPFLPGEFPVEKTGPSALTSRASPPPQAGVWEG